MDQDLAWCAGLFVGEGHVKALDDHGNGRLRLLCVIEMQDERAVRKFADIVSPFVPPRRRPFQHMVGAHVLEYHKSGASRPAFRVRLYSRPAQAVLEVLYPYLEGTAKGDQIKTAFDMCGIQIGA